VRGQAHAAVARVIREENVWPHLLNVIAAAGLLAMAACSLRSSQPVSQSFTSMGTIATVSVADEYRDELGQLTDKVKKEFRRLESLFTTYQPDSEISRLSTQPGALAVSDDTVRILELSKRYGELSGGAFDVTVAPLVRLWGFGVRPPNNPPEPGEIQQALQSVDFRRIELGRGTAALPSGMSVDLGGIGKGYAVDRGFDLIRAAGVKAAMLDFGGNIRVLGQATRGENWTIGVRDPFNREQLIGKLSLPDGAAVATSGNYERFVEMGGRRYAHIIDPRTGVPVEGMAATTVVAPDATMSDALSTATFVLGIESGAKVIHSLPGTAALFVPDRQPLEIWLAPGMQRYFEPLPEYAASLHTAGAVNR
jgi:FAD:protein FMN transferase